MNWKLKRKLKRLIQKSKVQKAKKEFLEFQKFSVICFIANSPVDGNKPPEIVVAELLKWAVSIETEYFQKFISWLLLWFPKISKPIIKTFRNHPAYAMFGFAMCLALCMFHVKLKELSNSIWEWVRKKMKWLLIRFGIIIFLLMGITDLPPIPIKQAILGLISKLYAKLKSLSRLSPEIISEPKSQNERNTAIFLSVMAFFFLRALLKHYSQAVFEDLPFGSILIDLYKADHENPKDPMVPILF